MELVRGIKITDFCDENNLSTKERLNLFIQVCQAVQHAHQKGIIHRDLKPSNILVTVSEPGAPGCPKVIDFGIAKATQGRLTDHTVFTAFDQFIGTPAYMSPEQAMMTALDIDTRTDIYSLGVLLYELLTGKTPLDQKELLAVGLDEMRRTIREKEPIRPSTRLSTMLEGELTTTARHRHTEAPKLIHQLRGDLDCIVMKCLEKDRARRYETANGLAREVQRYLANEPVAARPPSTLYRFQKLARRNKPAFAAATAVAAALVMGLAGTAWEYLKERKARQRAVTAEHEKGAEAAKLASVSDLFERMLTSANPDSFRGSDYTVRQMLDDFTAGLNNPLSGQPPEVEATVRLEVGWTYFRLGVISKAEPNLRRAVELRRSALGPTNLETLDAQHRLVRLLLSAQGKWEEGTRLSFETWQSRVRVLGPENKYTVSSQESYAEALRKAGRAEESVRIQRQIVQIRERTLPPDDWDTITAYGNLGQALAALGAHAQAEEYFREAVTRLQRTGRTNIEECFTCSREIAMSRLMQGDPAEAVKVVEEVLPRAVERFPNHFVTLHLQRVLFRALADEGRLDEAEAVGKVNLEARLRFKANLDANGTARAQFFLGRVLVQNGKPEEAEPLLNQALTFFREDAESKPRPEYPAQAANWLGVIQLGRKAYPEAESLLLTDTDLFFNPATDITPNERRLAISHIVGLYEAWGKADKVGYWQKKLDALAPDFRK
jgi:tetratricopeptide (TPR) repeat protein